MGVENFSSLESQRLFVYSDEKREYTNGFPEPQDAFSTEGTKDLPSFFRKKNRRESYRKNVRITCVCFRFRFVVLAQTTDSTGCRSVEENERGSREASGIESVMAGDRERS